jgi:ATP-binding cassette subfamily C protein CydD
MTTTPTSPQVAHRKALDRLGKSAGRPLRLAMAAPLIGGALLIGQAWLLAGVLGQAIEGGAPLASLWPTLAAIAALVGARIIVSALGEGWGIAAAETIKQTLRLALFDAQMTRPLHWTDNRGSGALAAASLEQVEALDGYFARYLPAMVAAAMLPLAFAVVALPLDWVAGLLFLVTAPLIPVFMALAGWGAEAATRAQAGALSRLSGRFADRLRGLLTLKLMGQAESETRAIVSASEALRLRTMKVLRIAFLSSAVLEFFAALGVAGIALYVGLTFIGYLGINPGLGLSTGLFLLLMAPEIYQPLRTLAAHYHDRAAALAALAEIEKQFDSLPEMGDAVASAPQALPTPDLAAPLGITVTGLGLSSPDGRFTLINDTDLVVAPGEHVAVIGPSGSGKSSLIEALARLRPASGTIVFGDRPLAGIDESTLRRTIALLGQKPRLFAGTIAENIALGRPDARPAEIEAAALRACVTDFAAALPQWLDTPIADGGIGLSAGEGRRVALARLYLRDPAIVLLDEPTAHLDAATEARVLEGLVDFCNGRTLVLATHSLAAAACMHRTLRIAGGALLPALLPSLLPRRVAPSTRKELRA